MIKTNHTINNTIDTSRNSNSRQFISKKSSRQNNGRETMVRDSIQIIQHNHECYSSGENEMHVENALDCCSGQISSIKLAQANIDGFCIGGALLFALSFELIFLFTNVNKRKC